MLKLKYCPRCKGDVIVDRDHYGWYEQCIQCGYTGDLQSIVDVQKQQAPDGIPQKLSKVRKRGAR